MADDKLREALEELHLKLIEMAPADESTREKRDALAAHLREALDQEDLAGYHFSLTEALQDALASFQESHPKLANMIGGVMNLLGSIGI
jgi:hypothetical protein